ncbi:MAG: hypothetical protein QF415_03185 [Candidatus Undinarchaeales archaeon]|nr:hypothetical protein [Candidatus Undinarchaeales archaeon]MDP7491772.1 hypothetical protein [Candidatus Undinarchaeales archaeon]
MRYTKADAPYTGKLPAGCRLCVKGAKLVLFVTGVCGRGCFYCPLSDRRREVDDTWANERPIARDEDILLEAERMRALGAGVTGGDPLACVDRTVHLVRLLKEHQGERFHIHLYTDGSRATSTVLSQLHDAGVDEIRFHFAKDAVKHALELEWAVGAEVPVLPGESERLKAYLRFLDEAGAAFCNLNELEYTDRTGSAMREHGLVPSPEGCVVDGSYELGAELVRWAEEHTSLAVQLCPSHLKDGIQLANRYIRTAQNLRRPFERVTDDGLLEKGVVYTMDPNVMAAFPRRSWAPDPDKERIETSSAVARRLARKGLRCAIVREFPTADRYEAEVEPLAGGADKGL